MLKHLICPLQSLIPYLPKALLHIGKMEGFMPCLIKLENMDCFIVHYTLCRKHITHVDFSLLGQKIPLNNK